MLASTLLYLAGLASLGAAQYTLEDDYEATTFFDMFDFFTGADPTNGYVTYVDQTTAQSGGLVNTNNGAVYMGVDHTNVASGSGRSSVRLTSKKSYNHGLIVLDLAHMPGGVCGTWPAFWTVGPSWPTNGEIDIIEGVNSQASNDMTLHTGPGCSIKNNGAFSGTLTPDTNCDINAAGQATNAGCQIDTTNQQTYGSGFNAAQGGVYATEWTSASINIYFFGRGSIPSDISSGSPDPATWGKPLASFSGGCEIDSFFKNQQIVFDTTFCGDWAGNVWTTDATCAPKAATCQAFVQNNPSAFVNAYWSVNSLKVYSSSGNASTPAPSSSVWASSIAMSTAVSTALPSSIPVSVSGRPPTTVSVLPTSILSQPKTASVPLSTASALPVSFFSKAAISVPTSSAPGATTASVAPPTTMVTSAAGSGSPYRHTVSALQIGDFPGEGVTQTAGVNKKRDAERRKRHLLEHQRKGLERHVLDAGGSAC